MDNANTNGFPVHKGMILSEKQKNQVRAIEIAREIHVVQFRKTKPVND